MKDVEGRDQDKTCLIPTLNNGCYEIFFFSLPPPQLMFFISSAGADPHGPIVCGSGLPCAALPAPPRSLLLLLEESRDGVTRKDALPAEDPQGITCAEAGKWSHRPPTVQGRAPLGRPSSKRPQGRRVSLLDTIKLLSSSFPAAAAFQSTRCNCSLLQFFIWKHVPFKNVLFF